MQDQNASIYARIKRSCFCLMKRTVLKLDIIIQGDCPLGDQKIEGYTYIRL